MGFSADIISNAEAERERQARRDQWICSPGTHVVEIVGWEYEKARVGRNVVFTVQDDGGRKQYVRFGLTVRALRDGELLRFVVAAMNWVPVEHQGREMSIADRSTYKELVGRRIAIVVRRGANGLHHVVDWAGVAQ